jgi:hypothetical protein
MSARTLPPPHPPRRQRGGVRLVQDVGSVRLAEPRSISIAALEMAHGPALVRLTSIGPEPDDECHVEGRDSVSLRLHRGQVAALIRLLERAAREAWGDDWTITDPRARAAARDARRDDELPRRGGLEPRRPGQPRGRVQP